MQRLIAGGRRKHDRTVVGEPENVAAHVDGADIDEPARAQLKFQEAVAIGAQRHLIVEPRRHISEVGRRNILPHHRLEVEHVDGLARVADGILCVARHRNGALGVGPWAAARKQRTSRQELEEAATVDGPARLR
jgi:hypothetical protein